VGLEMSADYCALAAWRVRDPRQREKARKAANLAGAARVIPA
jgi:hypothetical protein